MSDQTQIEQNEEPLLALPPGLSIIAPHKPLIEMTDEELSSWHAKLRDHKNHQTLVAHLNAVSVKPETKAAKATPKKPDMTEFV